MGPKSALRWVRAAVFAGTCSVLAAFGHVLGGGSLHRPALLAGFLIILVPSVVLTGRERTLHTILPATALSQIVLHVLLSEAAPHAPVTVHAGMPGMSQGSAGTSMLLMHAVSVLVTSVWLEWGERGLCALARVLVGWVLAALVFLGALVLPAAGRPGVRGHDRSTRRPVRWSVLRHAVIRRGPPLGASAPGAVLRGTAASA